MQEQRNKWYLKDTCDELNEVPDGATGFVYIISNITNGKKYIGRKQFKLKQKRKLGKKELAKVNDKRKKNWKYVYKEDWQNYTGSSNELNEDIANGDTIKKEVLKICYSKKQMSYYETYFQFLHNVLLDDNYYNSCISGKYYKSDLI